MRPVRLPAALPNHLLIPLLLASLLSLLFSLPTRAQDLCGDLNDLDCVVLNQALANSVALLGDTQSALIEFELRAALQTTDFGETALHINGVGPLLRATSGDLLETAFDLNLTFAADLPDFGGWGRILVRSVDGVVYTRLPFGQWQATSLPDSEQLQESIILAPDDPELDVQLPTLADVNDALAMLLGGLAQFAEVPGYVTITRAPDVATQADFRVVLNSSALFESMLFINTAQALDEPTLGLAPLLPLLFQDAVIELHLLVDTAAVRVNTLTLDARTSLNLRGVLDTLGVSGVGVVSDLVESLPSEPLPATLYLRVAASGYDAVYQIEAPLIAPDAE